MRRHIVTRTINPTTEEPMVACQYSRHLHSVPFKMCVAFPEPFPLRKEIYSPNVRHDTPYPGDHGILFEAKTQNELDQELRDGSIDLLYP